MSKCKLSEVRRSRRHSILLAIDQEKLSKLNGLTLQKNNRKLNAKVSQYSTILPDLGVFVAEPVSCLLLGRFSLLFGTVSYS